MSDEPTYGGLTEDQAIRMYHSGWWIGMPARDVAMFQLHEPRLCMPWPAFMDALNNALGRPVYNHELGLDREGIRRELMGERAAPTFAEVVALLPADKRVIIWPDGHVGDREPEKGKA